MTTTLKKTTIKGGVTKVSQDKWRQLTVWFSTSETDDVEIVDAFIVQLGMEVGVAAKSSAKLVPCLESLRGIQVCLETSTTHSVLGQEFRWSTRKISSGY